MSEGRARPAAGSDRAASPGGTLRAFRGVWPRVHPSVFVAAGAILVGDVEVGEDSSVWYGCVLRGDVHAIRIGARSNVQDLSVLHVTQDRFSCEVGDEVTIGHRAVVHGCSVRDGALIGIGAIVLDGAEIGEGALIGAGSVVTPGARIAPGMLAMGVPAREVRRLSEEESSAQRGRTLRYVETARQHADSEG